eukprot:TRINITY_DN17331_c0_g1_i1.p1 TRINITY_DN17331_c0_g1~~TRINITY_DN17331_c0_g1_i1.p1  ORF type:complete len:169 (-),score=5.81 TRINITY_DN17331_c0_g1_i1:515-1021(-)
MIHHAVLQQQGSPESAVTTALRRRDRHTAGKCEHLCSHAVLRWRCEPLAPDKAASLQNPCQYILQQSHRKRYAGGHSKDAALYCMHDGEPNCWLRGQIELMLLKPPMTQNIASGARGRPMNCPRFVVALPRIQDVAIDFDSPRSAIDLLGSATCHAGPVMWYQSTPCR